MTTTETAVRQEMTAPDGRARANLTAFALAAAGVGITIGHLLTVPSDQKMTPYLDQLAAHRTTGVIGGLLTAIGAFLVVPGLADDLPRLRERGGKLFLRLFVVIRRCLH